MNLNDTGTKVLLIAVVILSGLVITGALFWSSRPATPPPTVDTTTIPTENSPSIGSATAPLTIIEWADYQCPACKQFEQQTFPQLLTDYVNTGKVKVVFKDFAFLGEDSITAGEYGRAIWKLYPEKYLAWRTAMYTAQDEEKDIGFGDAESIDKLNATIVGIDVANVAADVKANRTTYRAQMDTDKAEGKGIGVNSTPSFVIGTQLMAGAYPYPAFKAAIDTLLK